MNFYMDTKKIIVVRARQHASYSAIRKLIYNLIFNKTNKQNYEK